MRAHAVLMLLLAAATAPLAAADPTCVDPVCVTAGEFAQGDGSCSAGAPFYASDVVLSASVNAAGSYYQAYADNGCYSFDDPAYQESGTFVNAGYYGFDSGGSYQALVASWYAYSWTGGSVCSIGYYGTALGGGDSTDCVVGPPPYAGDLLP